MEAESAPLLNAWIGPMTTFMGGALTAVAAGLYRSAHARIQDLSDRLSGISVQQAADVAALRRERAEGDAEVKATLSELRSQVATRSDVEGLAEQVKELREVILNWGRASQ
jgi:hypothetical protein